jgi:hypothetical protein
MTTVVGDGGMTADGVDGSTASSNQSGVFGNNASVSPAPAGSPGGNGVFGVSTVPNASGVFGAHNNAGTGVTGLSVKGDGIRGITHTSAKCGVVGINDDTAAAPVGTPEGNGVFGNSRVPNASGVFGGHSGGGYGVSGVTNSPLGPPDVGGNANDPRIHAGVWGHNSGRGYGVRGTAQIVGIYGVASQIGIMAQGGIGLSALGDRTGVSASGSDAAVSGTSPNRGVAGFADTCGVFGNCNPAGATHPVVDVSGLHGMGVLGVGVDTGALGLSRDGAGVVGSSLTGTGVGAVTLGTGQNANAIYAACPTQTAGYAGYFSGRVHVSGYLEKAGGGFKIDHPLDPANSYLTHSFLESDEMKNLYDGIVTLDADGGAVVEVADWFEALNEDFRYQLTALGAPAPTLHVAEELHDRRFRIAGGPGGGRVSWQLTGNRKDPWAQANRPAVTADKDPAERGLYLHPHLYGQPESASTHHRLAPPFET